MAPPVAPPLRAHGAAPSLAEHQRSKEYTDTTELQHIILLDYSMLEKKKQKPNPKTVLLTSGQSLTKPISSSRVSVLYSLNIDSLPASDVQMDYEEFYRETLPGF